MTPDAPAALHTPPASPHQSKAPSLVHVPVSVHGHSFCCTVTNTNQPHLQTIFWTVSSSSHHLTVSRCLCSAFNAILLFSYYVSLPLYLSMKTNKIKFCQLYVSVVSCCSHGQTFCCIHIKPIIANPIESSCVVPVVPQQTQQALVAQCP